MDTDFALRLNERRIARLAFAGACAVSCFVTAACLISIAGCDLVLCKPEPTEAHGVCDPNQPTCGGGSATPAPDTINDGAVDIDSFDRAVIPTRVVLKVPNEGRLHVPEGTVLSYQHDPPASGPHFDTPAETGYYCDTLNKGHWVHSLEHGDCVLLFDESRPAARGMRGILSLLPMIFPQSPNFNEVRLVVTPYSNLPHAFCLVTWNRQFYLDDFDIGAMMDFYTRYIDLGPEFIP